MVRIEVPAVLVNEPLYDFLIIYLSAPYCLRKSFIGDTVAPTRITVREARKEALSRVVTEM
jgi:hypothetical protein